MDADFILCQAPGRSGLYRLAATQTEVPPTEMQAAVPSPDFANTYPPLWDGLGTLTYKITTSDPQAQAYFDQGLRLAYGFNHAAVNIGSPAGRERDHQSEGTIRIFGRCH